MLRPSQLVRPATTCAKDALCRFQCISAISIIKARSGWDTDKATNTRTTRRTELLRRNIWVWSGNTIDRCRADLRPSSACDCKRFASGCAKDENNRLRDLRPARTMECYMD